MDSVFGSDSPEVEMVLEKDSTSFCHGEQDPNTPYLGQIFQTYDEAKEFYIDFGREKGFSVVTKSSQKRKRGYDGFTCYVLACERYGHPKSQATPNVVNLEKEVIKRNTSTAKCDCKACMRLSKNDDETWRVTKFSNIHNHGMVSPSKRNRMSVNRYFPKGARALVEAFREENLPVGKVVSILDGNVVGFDERDCYNHIGSMRNNKTPTANDATSMLNFLKRKNIEDPHFFYAIQPDLEGRAVNFFWVDGRSRMQYELFGDVLYFDTTYRKNVYGMPFAPFTGVNHHLQSIQFGCALMLDETEDSFVWAFETFLGAMGGRHPISIITDQDKAMGLAIARVFPDSRHRYCLWHILKKFPMYLSHVYFKKSAFKREIKFCIRGTYRVPDFEKMWNELMEKYDLVGNEWLTELFKIREKWAPVYHLCTFYAAMSTTGRSEGMNSFYKDFFTHLTTLIEFVQKNEKCLMRIAQRERDEDHTSEHKDRLVKETSFLLDHASRMYTRNVYVKFKEQWDKSILNFKLKVTRKIDDTTTYTYISRKKDDNREWNVEFNSKTLEGKCECQYFEFMGIPCGHLIKVFQREDMDEIPDFFIVKRWMQGANQYRVKYDGGAVSSHNTSKVQRISHLSKLSTQLIYDAGEEDDTYTWMLEHIDELARKYKEHKDTLKTSTGCDASQSPSDSTQIPHVASQSPVDSTQIPKFSSQSPIDSTLMANVTSHPPTDSTQIPNDDSPPPIESTQIPNDISPVSIDFSQLSSHPPLMPSDPSHLPYRTQSTVATQTFLLNPKKVRSKGRPKNPKDHSSTTERFKSSLEMNNKKSKKKKTTQQKEEGRLCHGCDKRGTGHNIRNCPNPKIKSTNGKGEKTCKSKGDGSSGSK